MDLKTDLYVSNFSQALFIVIVGSVLMGIKVFIHCRLLRMLFYIIGSNYTLSTACQGVRSLTQTASMETAFKTFFLVY